MTHEKIPNKIQFFFILILITVSSVCFSGSEIKDEQLKEQLRQDTLAQIKFSDENFALYREAGLNEYLTQIGRRILNAMEVKDPERFQFSVLRSPIPQAMSTVTAHVYLTLGMFTILENEAQLAFVIAHEISHVIHEDTFWGARDSAKKTVASKTADLIFAGPSATFGFQGLSESTTSLISQIAITAHSRKDEIRSDLEALEAISKIGYEPNVAAPTLQNLQVYGKKYKMPEPVFFLSTHPAGSQRAENLVKWVREHKGGGGKLGSDEYLAKTYQARLFALRSYLNFDQHIASLEIVNKLIMEKAEDPWLYYYRGEVYFGMLSKGDHLWTEVDDSEKELKAELKAQSSQWWLLAWKSYRRAIEIDPSFSDAYLGLGYCYMKQGDLEEANRYFNQYETRNPTDPFEPRGIQIGGRDMTAEFKRAFKS